MQEVFNSTARSIRDPYSNTAYVLVVPVGAAPLVPVVAPLVVLLLQGGNPI